MKLLFLYLFILNIIGLSVMYIDKKKAIKSKNRISEKNLLVISFLGGCIGSYIGMHIFHHKTKHIKFITLIPVSIILWILLLIYFYKK